VCEPEDDIDIPVGGERRSVGSADKQNCVADLAGLGAAVAKRLARDGFTVVVNYSGDAAPAEALVRKIEDKRFSSMALRLLRLSTVWLSMALSASLRTGTTPSARANWMPASKQPVWPKARASTSVSLPPG
jgi:hypothetical protein